VVVRACCEVSIADAMRAKNRPRSNGMGTAAQSLRFRSRCIEKARLHKGCHIEHRGINMPSVVVANLGKPESITKQKRGKEEAK
jgi:hypothetical protein